MINLKIKNIILITILTFTTFSFTTTSFAEDNSVSTQKKEVKKELTCYTSIEEGFSVAKKEKKLVLINFCANWCESCKELDKYTYSNEQVISEINSNFINIKINLSKLSDSTEITNKYNIEELPAILFFNKNAELLNKYRVVGFAKPTEFLKLLNEVKNHE